MPGPGPAQSTVPAEPHSPAAFITTLPRPERDVSLISSIKSARLLTHRAAQLLDAFLAARAASTGFRALGLLNVKVEGSTATSGGPPPPPPPLPSPPLSPPPWGRSGGAGVPRVIVQVHRAGGEPQAASITALDAAVLAVPALRQAQGHISPMPQTRWRESGMPSIAFTPLTMRTILPLSQSISPQARPRRPEALTIFPPMPGSGPECRSNPPQCPVYAAKKSTAPSQADFTASQLFSALFPTGLCGGFSGELMLPPDPAKKSTARPMPETTPAPEKRRPEAGDRPQRRPVSIGNCGKEIDRQVPGCVISSRRWLNSSPKNSPMPSTALDAVKQRR